MKTRKSFIFYIYAAFYSQDKNATTRKNENNGLGLYFEHCATFFHVAQIIM